MKQEHIRQVYVCSWESIYDVLTSIVLNKIIVMQTTHFGLHGMVLARTVLNLGNFLWSAKGT